MLKIDQIFPIFFSLKNIGLEDQLLIKNVFENFDFYSTFLKVCPFFVSSIHNFGRSDGDIVY